MEIKDIVFEPHNDMGIDDSDIVTQHKKIIDQNKFDDAYALLNNNNYKKGFRASLFNSIQNKLRMLEVYLLNEFVAGSKEFYSLEEPDTAFMEENGYDFWLQPY